MDRIRSLREQRGWSQAVLAERAGVTRPLIGAIEAGRHTPNVTAAIAVAQALGVSVETLFGPSGDALTTVIGDAVGPGASVRTARVGDRIVAVPVRVAPTESWAVADATVDDRGLRWLPEGGADGVVIAGCDPLLGLLGALLERTSPHRLVAVHTSTGRALDALGGGRAHGALVHGPPGSLPDPAVPVRRWHVASWAVGLASSRSGSPPSVTELVERRATVVQRESGAGSQRALERALRAVGATSPLVGPVAAGHLDVARRVRDGRGRVGITMEAAAAAFGLGFTPLEQHDVELWIARDWSGLPSTLALLETLAGPALTHQLALVGGYDLHDCGRAVA